MVRQRAVKVAIGVLIALAVGSVSVVAQTEEQIEEAIRIFNRAKMLHQEREYGQAIKEYETAIKLDDQNPFIYNSLGLALTAIGRFGDALKAYQRAIELNPELTDVYNNMGVVYAEQGQKEKAFESFTRVIRNPGYPTPEKALYNLGNLYLDDGNFELALMHFQRSVEKEPKFALGYRGLARAYLAQGEIETAEINYEHAVELDANDAESLFNLAQINERRGDVQKARELYRKVIEADRFSDFGEAALKNLESLTGN